MFSLISPSSFAKGLDPDPRLQPVKVNKAEKKEDIKKMGLGVKCSHI